MNQTRNEKRDGGQPPTPLILGDSDSRGQDQDPPKIHPQDPTNDKKTPSATRQRYKLMVADIEPGRFFVA